MLPLIILLFFSRVVAQGLGSVLEIHPQLTTWSCTVAHGCIPRRTSVVLDSFARPIHARGSDKPCFNQTGFLYDSVCNDTATCLANCVMEGVQDYASHGVFTYPSRSYPYSNKLPPHKLPARYVQAPHGAENSVLELRQLNGSGYPVSPRVYLLNEDGRQYQMMKLLNREVSFDINVSKLPCGMNSAMYLSEMDRFGGAGKKNPGGAMYGTGYCDAQCPKLPFINGEANTLRKGSCCNEFDIWEGNSEATAFTAHPCNITGVYRCTGDFCGVDGVCSQTGCGINPYSTGARNFYGRGLTVDTSQTITVVTQFHAPRHGVLESVHRLYIQRGVVLGARKMTVRSPRKSHKSTSSTTKTSFAASATKTTSHQPKPTNRDTLAESFCKAIDAETYLGLGGMQAMGDALNRGMVLVFSVWWDEESGMGWLDSGKAGRCSAGSGYPKFIVKQEQNPSVRFSNIKYGEIGSTFKLPVRGAGQKQH
ncbi:hypothetical protein TD95_003229 [Thielaviopsis punctulata]|uniref:Glucanase n=1 Tax=Thielaviopsis punctulata TaxID=72032 RepID=A0A0F4ZD09_9PEZI|nr:hypothetical protein TD95_003229 [Thielaviopsis punctulata]